MKKRMLDVTSMVLCLLLAIGVVTVFKACGVKEDGTWMHCHHAQNDVLVMALIMAGVSVVTAMLPDGRLRTLLHAIALALAVVTALLPGMIVDLCMMRSMRCHSVMRPYVIIMCAAFSLVKLVMMVRGVCGCVKRKEALA
ncbi:MAG: DUF4418 family protein [Lachnospiraceae bacterium]|nr:DUF4418 family protein [Lachnospiraceae bacterium]